MQTVIAIKTVSFEQTAEGFVYFNENTRKFYPATAEDIEMLEAMIKAGMEDAFEIWSGDVDPIEVAA